MHSTIGIIRKQGILALYNGLSASLLRQLTYSTIRFGAYEVGAHKKLARENYRETLQKMWCFYVIWNIIAIAVAWSCWYLAISRLYIVRNIALSQYIWKITWHFKYNRLVSRRSRHPTVHYHFTKSYYWPEFPVLQAVFSGLLATSLTYACRMISNYRPNWEESKELMFIRITSLNVHADFPNYLFLIYFTVTSTL